tara:strand:+ start:163 stop:312 length:150 start_codon:yes stop_codon:yes gene_type:complete
MTEEIEDIEPGSKKEETLKGPELTPDEVRELEYKKKLEELRKRDPFVYR